MHSSNVATNIPAGITPEATAPWSRVSFGPPGPWVTDASFERDLPAKEGDHLTHLLWERQIEVETGTSFHCAVTRLETSLAVQHQSQWRLNLDPRFQHLTLHWLRIVRNGQHFDHLRRDRLRLIQRETQLEHLVIDGQWTLLTVLDDVRPGDTLEVAYSFTGNNPVRPEGCEVFFFVPPGHVVGRFRLHVEFARSRPDMGWLAGTDVPERKEEQLPNDRLRWSWEGSQLKPREPEPNTPGHFLDYLWVQMSDLPEWGPLALRLNDAWNRTSDGTGLDQFPGFAPPVEVNESAICHLVQSIQDEFRYLSVDLESGGWIPMSPATVARRRYGDCKDLAWMAACVLRSWGVEARPVLVGTGLRHSVKKLRPMALLFNHAVLEVEIGGKMRWFDLTMRHQGGDFATQPVPWFGAGLPIDAATRSLRDQPGSRLPGLYAVRETILLDTRRDEMSTVEVRVRAEGWNADVLRSNRHTQGPDEFAKERLAHARRRYGKAERIGTLQWRDDRQQNVCELTEAFEVRDVIYPGENVQRALFDVPANLMLQAFVLPELKARRSPWALPSRAEIRHEITVKARSLGAASGQRRRWVRPEFTATLVEPRDAGSWSKIMRFSVTADEVATEHIAEYRQRLKNFLEATSWRLFLPWKEARLHPPEEFGLLPAPDQGIAAYVPPVNLASFDDAPEGVSPSHLEPPGSSVSGKQESYRPTTGSDGGASWKFIGPLLVFAAFAASRSCETSNLTLPASLQSRSSLLPESQVSLPPTEPVFSAPANNSFLPPEQNLFLSPQNQVSLRFGEALVPPEVISKVEPEYPPELMKAGKAGRVVLEFVVTTRGGVEEIKEISSDDPLFTASAIRALSQWKFTSPRIGTRAVRSHMQVPMIFQPDDAQKKAASP